MNGDISIDIGSAIPYAIDRILSLFGKDALCADFKKRLNRQLKIAAQEASWVQCIGMDRPIPIDEIYQPTRLTTSRDVSGISGHFIDFLDLLKNKSDAIIFGGPGSGKTTLLHWTYTQLFQSKKWIPILYTLRWPDAVNDLSIFIAELSGQGSKQLKNLHLALLVDGYDEVKTNDRPVVSEVLREFSSLGLGNFYLTCRSFYDVVDLKAPHYRIADFNRADALGYLGCFSRAYRTEFSPTELLRELDEHGLGDFSSHPLLLALVCILKSGPMPQLPKSTIGLIRRAIDTLTFRWDESKGLGRESRIDLDGEERVRCLMRVAYHMQESLITEQALYTQVETQLKLFQRRDVNVQSLLMEIAAWYGFFVPTSESSWTFSHRTMHDYLAARYWVESGQYSPVYVKEWSTRAAYAACLLPDATNSVIWALRSGAFFASIECLYNNAPMNPHKIADAILEYFTNNGHYRVERTEKSLSVSTSRDFFSLVREDLLNSLLSCGLARRERKLVHDFVFAYVLSEFERRKIELPPEKAKQAQLLFPTEGFQFHIESRGTLNLVSCF